MATFFALRTDSDTAFDISDVSSWSLPCRSLLCRSAVGSNTNWSVKSYGVSADTLCSVKIRVPTKDTFFVCIPMVQTTLQMASEMWHLLHVSNLFVRGDTTRQECTNLRLALLWVWGSDLRTWRSRFQTYVPLLPLSPTNTSSMHHALDSEFSTLNSIGWKNHHRKGKH